MARAPAVACQRSGIRGSGDAPGRRQQHPAGGVGDPEVRRRLLALGAQLLHRSFDEHGAPRRADDLCGRLEFGGDEFAQLRLIGEQRFQVVDPLPQLVAFGFELEAGELRESTQLQVEDVGGLQLGEVEDLHQTRPGAGGILGGADELDDLVDVEDRDEQTLDEVEPVLGLAQLEHRATADDVDAVGEVDHEQVAQPQRRGLSVDEADVVDAEGLLQGGLAVELGQHRLGVEPVLDPDDQAHSVLAVGIVIDRGDAGQLLRPHGVLDLRHDLLRTDEVGQLGDDDALAAGADVLERHGRPGAEGSASGLIGLAHTVEADDPTARGQIGPGNEAHEFGQTGVRVADEMRAGGDDLTGIVRGHVRGHAHGDARCAVDEQIREGARQHLGLGQRVVIIADEVDDVFVEPGDHLHRRGRQSGLGVARGRGTVVEGTEIAVAVDQGHPHDEVLAQTHQRVVDRRVAVRVEFAHDVADDAGGLHMAALRAQSHIAHLVDDASLHRFEAVTGIGKCA